MSQQPQLLHRASQNNYTFCDGVYKEFKENWARYSAITLVAIGAIIFGHYVSNATMGDRAIKWTLVGVGIVGLVTVITFLIFYRKKKESFNDSSTRSTVSPTDTASHEIDTARAASVTTGSPQRTDSPSAVGVVAGAVRSATRTDSPSASARSETRSRLPVHPSGRDYEVDKDVLTFSDEKNSHSYRKLLLGNEYMIYRLQDKPNIFYRVNLGDHRKILDCDMHGGDFTDLITRSDELDYNMGVMRFVPAETIRLRLVIVAHTITNLRSARASS